MKPVKEAAVGLEVDAEIFLEIFPALAPGVEDSLFPGHL